MMPFTDLPIRQLTFAFAGGALFLALLTLGGTASAQTLGPGALGLQQMFEWCRQTLAETSGTVQGMLSGLCMLGG